MRKVKLLFLINTLKGGGAEKVLVDMVNSMDSERFDITVQTIGDSGVHREALGARIHYKSIVKVKNGFLYKLFMYLVQFVLPPKLVYNWFVRQDYDFEVSYLEGVPAKILSGSTNKKAKRYAWIHTDMYTNFSAHQKIYKDVAKHKKMYDVFDKIICVSQGAKEGFIKRFGETENIEVLCNLYNDKHILASAKEEQTAIPEEDTFKIISVGRLTEVKGFDRLLKVHKRLVDEGLMHKLYILGEGEKRAELEAYIRENALESSVRLLGFSKNPYKYMQACDLFVCSSYAEGLSTVVAETLILGKPVVSTQVAGADELLAHDKAGMLVENSEQGIYDGIKTMLTDKEKYNAYVCGAQERSMQLKAEVLIQPIEALFEL